MHREHMGPVIKPGGDQVIKNYHTGWSCG